MPISKARDAERKRKQRRNGVSSIMSSADVRAMHKAGLTPEYIEDEPGKIKASLYYALLRDRDAIKEHLGWLQDAMGKAGHIKTSEVILSEEKVNNDRRLARLKDNRVGIYEILHPRCNAISQAGEG